MDFKMIISLMAIFISIFTFVLNYWERRKTSISNIRPILVFHYTEEDIWKVVNVGNGPALNIVIAHKNKQCRQYINQYINLLATLEASVDFPG